MYSKKVLLVSVERTFSTSGIKLYKFRELCVKTFSVKSKTKIVLLRNKKL